MINLIEPHITESDEVFVDDALESGEISGVHGKYTKMFEESVAKYCGCKHGISTCNGTAALHAALLALGIGPGDEVITTDYTMASSLFSILHAGATPKIVDIDETWNMDCSRIEPLINSRTKAIMPVHIYGNPCNMDAIMAIAEKHNLRVIEDVCEAFGADYQSQKVGSIGDVGCHSFYATKMITTGEGGMVTTNSTELSDKLRKICNLGYGGSKKYMHQLVGYNYRLSNMQSALGMSQIAKIHRIVGKKRFINDMYRKHLDGVVQFQQEQGNGKSVYWMNGILSPHIEEIKSRLTEKHIQYGDMFIPMHLQKIFTIGVKHLNS
jgi:perosamine synthetase